MAVISTPSLNKVLDELVHAMVLAEGNSTSGSGYPNGYGIGTEGGSSGAAGRLQQILTDIGAETDPEIASMLYQALDSAIDNTSAIKMIGARFKAMLGRLNSHARTYGSSNFSTLEGMLAYYNTGGGGTWAALQDYRWRDLWNVWYGGSTYPAVSNVYFEVLQGTADAARHLYLNALRKAVVSGSGAEVETAGQTIDSSLYGGGIPALTISGITGTGTIVATCVCRVRSTGATESGVTIEFTVTGNGRFYRTGGTASADALVLQCTSVTTPAGISAGTYYIEAERPALRTGTAQAGASTTITLDANASAIDDYYTGLQIGHTGDRYTLRTITDYVGSTKVATVNSAWATNPTGSDTFRILRKKLV